MRVSSARGISLRSEDREQGGAGQHDERAGEEGGDGGGVGDLAEHEDAPDAPDTMMLTRSTGATSAYGRLYASRASSDAMIWRDRGGHTFVRVRPEVGEVAVSVGRGRCAREGRCWRL